LKELHANVEAEVERRMAWTIEGNCGQWFDAWASVVNTVCAR
jgi:hypothetical protein